MKEEIYERASEIKQQLSRLPVVNLDQDGNIKLSAYAGISLDIIKFLIEDDLIFRTDNNNILEAVIMGDTRDWILAKIENKRRQLLEEFEKL